MTLTLPDRTSRDQLAQTLARLLAVGGHIVDFIKRAAGGGELLGAAFKFLGELVAQQAHQPPAQTVVAELRAGLEACAETTADGQPRLTVTLPDRASLESLAQTLARLLNVGSPTTGAGDGNVLVPLTVRHVTVGPA